MKDVENIETQSSVLAGFMVAVIVIVFFAAVLMMGDEHAEEHETQIREQNKLFMDSCMTDKKYHECVLLAKENGLGWSVEK